MNSSNQLVDRTADMNKVVQAHSVGFLLFDRSGRGLASRSSGSGTLVDFLGIRGIVTAVHVANAIRSEAEVGIAFFGPGNEYRTHTCRGDQLDVVSIGDSISPSEGPDLAFVRMPLATENGVAVTQAFFNTSVRVKMQEQGFKRSSSGPTFLTGMISEFSRSLGTVGAVARTEHVTINGVGYIEDAALDEHGVDRLNFRISHHGAFPTPSTYEGLSGGGLWMLGEGADVLSRTLIGVAYYESPTDEQGERYIRCHGPMSIFEVLYLAVLDRYLPDAAAEHRATPWPGEGN